MYIGEISFILSREKISEALIRLRECAVWSVPLLFYCNKVRMVAKIRNRYNQVPPLTQDTIWESDKNTIKHHKRESRGPFPAGDYKTAMNRRESITDTSHK